MSSFLAGLTILCDVPSCNLYLARGFSSPPGPSPRAGAWRACAAVGRPVTYCCFAGKSVVRQFLVVFSWHHWVLKNVAMDTKHGGFTSFYQQNMDISFISNIQQHVCEKGSSIFFIVQCAGASCFTDRDPSQFSGCQEVQRVLRQEIHKHEAWWVRECHIYTSRTIG